MKLLVVIVFLISFSSCTHAPLPEDHADHSLKLEEAIASLSDSINIGDARLISEVLVASTSELAQTYRMTSPPQYHNLLVKMGLRERGLCCHWTEDLRSRLLQVNQGTIQFDWLVSKHGSSLSEHNTIVIYAENMSWQQGMIFDPWRKAGRPYWIRVRLDKYPWQLHPLSGQWELLRCK